MSFSGAEGDGSSVLESTEVDPQADKYLRNITETFLNASDLTQASPVNAEKDAADRRAIWFERETWALLAALAFLASLVFEILMQLPGRWT